MITPQATRRDRLAAHVDALRYAFTWQGDPPLIHGVATNTQKPPAPIAIWRAWQPWLAWPLAWLAGVWIIHQVATLSGNAPPDWYEALCNVLWLIDIVAFFAARRAARREEHRE